MGRLERKRGPGATGRESGKNGSLLLVAYNAGDPGFKVFVIISSLEFLTPTDFSSRQGTFKGTERLCFEQRNQSLNSAPWP